MRKNKLNNAFDLRLLNGVVAVFHSLVIPNIIICKIIRVHKKCNNIYGAGNNLNNEMLEFGFLNNWISFLRI